MGYLLDTATLEAWVAAGHCDRYTQQVGGTRQGSQRKWEPRLLWDTTLLGDESKVYTKVLSRAEIRQTLDTVTANASLLWSWHPLRSRVQSSRKYSHTHKATSHEFLCTLLHQSCKFLTQCIEVEVFPSFWLHGSSIFRACVTLKRVAEEIEEEWEKKKDVSRRNHFNLSISSPFLHRPHFQWLCYT